MINSHLLANAPPQLLKNRGLQQLWEEEDSGPIPTDIQLVRSQPKAEGTADENLRTQLEMEPNAFMNQLGQRFPLSDYTPVSGQVCACLRYDIIIGNSCLS